jgi:hypothetical protein
MAGLLIPNWLIPSFLLVCGIALLVHAFSWEAAGFVALGAILLAVQIHGLVRRIRQEDSERR